MVFTALFLLPPDARFVPAAWACRMLLIGCCMCQVLPTLKFCAERDETVAIQLCVLGCYDAVAKRLERLGPVAAHILPACTPMLACKGLNSNQFEMAVGIVQGMLETVIAYRRRQIANPSATAIIENKPTHAGGEPDEAEIARLRNAVLGGWKPPSPSSASKRASGPSPLSSTFPKAPTSSPPASLDVADIFSTTPASAGVASAPSPAFSGKFTPVRNTPTPVATAAGLGNKGARSPGGGAGPYGGATSASSSTGIFQGLAVSQKEPVTVGAGSATLPGGVSDPFASAGLSDPFGPSSGSGGNKPAQASGGGMSWMDGAFGAGGGGAGGLGGANAGGLGGSNSIGSPLQASGINASSGAMGGFSGGGMPPPQQGSGRLSMPASGAPDGDPFAAFFDGAITGGTGPASSSQQVPPFVAPRPPATTAAGTGGGFMGGFGAPPAGGGAVGHGGGDGGGGDTLEDQLAKTQKEIAQLTLELGGAGGMAAAVGGAAAQAGWGMMGGASAPPAPPGGHMGGAGTQGWMGGGNGGVSGQGPAQSSQDPFAFLGADSQGGQQGNSQGGPGSNFDFLR